MRRFTSKQIKDFGLDILFMVAGAAIYATTVNLLTAPNHIAPGGVTGIATMINFMFGTPIGLVAFCLNVPIVIWAILDIGYKFVMKTLGAIVLSSLFIDLFSLFIKPYEGDIMIVAIMAGIMEGIGLSLTFLRGATTGGTDMAARLLTKRFRHIPMGKLMMVLDGAIVLVSAFVYGSIENAMYACIVIFVGTNIIDTILYGADSGTGKMFFVMSKKVEEMGERIMEEMNRGVTYFSSRGGYTKREGEVLLCAVRRFEVYRINKIIREIDRDAFVIVGDAGEISGEGFKPTVSDDKSLKEIIKKLSQKNDEKNQPDDSEMQ